MIQGKRFSTSPVEIISSLVQYRQLIWNMTRRDVIGRYRGSFLGMAWSFFNPLLMLAVYTFVFSLVFRARWDTGTDSRMEFALVLFIGMMTHGLLAECVNRSPGLITNNSFYVKKIVFPLEIQSWIIMCSALFHLLISLCVWSLIYILVNRTFNWTIVFLPVIYLPLVFFSLGFSWFLSSIGVFLRDVSQITGVFTTILLFLSPVFYPMSAIPEQYRMLIYLNPLTFIIEQARDVLMWGMLPDWPGLAVSFSGGILVAWLGFAWFQKTRRGFADVL